MMSWLVSLPWGPRPPPDITHSRCQARVGHVMSRRVSALSVVCPSPSAACRGRDGSPRSAARAAAAAADTACLCCW